MNRMTEVEQILLGALMVMPNAWDHADFLDQTNFSTTLHGSIYQKIKELSEDGKDPTPAIIGSFFDEKKYVHDMADNVFAIPVDVDYHAKLIKEEYLRLSLSNLCDRFKEEALDTESNPLQAVARIENELTELTKTDKELDYTFDQVLVGTELFIQGLQEGKTGLKTGIRDLDAKMNGMKGGDLIILAGRPGMGKSALGLNIASNVAMQGDPVLFFSLEMSKEQLGQRMLARYSGVPMDKHVDPNKAMQIVEASGKLKGTPLYICESGGISISQAVNHARRSKRKNGIKMIVIDYLGLMRPTDSKANKVHQIEEITVRLKALAKDLGIPIILLSQLNRGVETRDDKRPLLADLRDSGSIEQDADCVLFVYREEYYLEKAEPSDPKKQEAWEQSLAAAKGRAQIIVAKMRQGTTGTIHVKFNGGLQHFFDLTN